MKRGIIVLILAVVMIGLLLPACSNGAEVENLRAQLTALNGEVAARDSKITDLQTQVASRNQTIADQKDELSSSKAQVANLQKQVSEKNQKLSNLNDDLKVKDGQMADLQNQVGDLKKKLADVPKDQPQAGLQDWQSVEELKAFLAADDTDHHIILKADKNGVVQFNGQCEDFAFQLRDRAFNIGRRLDTETLTRQECYKYKQYLSGDVSTLGPNDGHYLNKAVIENEVWFVEPSNDKIWLAYYLD